MLKYFVEFIGSFLFFSVVLLSGEAIPIAIALAAAILFGGKISGGHFNPAVSFMMFIQNKLSDSDFVIYIAIHLLAAAAAVYLYKNRNINK